MRLRTRITLWRGLALLVSSGLLFLPREAHLSQVHYQGISLERLISRSDFVLIVKPATPARQQVTISIGKDDNGKAAPDFVRVKLRVEVQESLTKAGANLVGKTLEIDGAHWEKRLHLHKSYYLHHISKSPIYETYRASEPPSESEQKDGPYIAFLRHPDKDSYAFVVEGATERIANRATVESALAAKK